MASSPKFNFPLETLTPIIRKPTNTTLQILQRQLFTNARSVPSTRGGGIHGHLAVLLSPADYLQLLSGARDHTTGLWHLGLNADTSDTMPPSISDTTVCLQAPPLLHHSYKATHSATPAKLVAFAHAAALFSPALSMLLQALERGYLPQCMGLTAQTLRKHPPQSIAMVKGHLDQTRKNQRSTKSTPPLPPLPSPETEISDEDATFSCSDPANTRTHHCYAAVVEPSRGQIYSDQTGKFVVASSTGNNYIVVVYDYDSNSILVELIRSRTGPCILAAFTVIHARLASAGLRPQLQCLDNECSEALKTFLTAEAISSFNWSPPPKSIAATLPKAQSARSKITS